MSPPKNWLTTDASGDTVTILQKARKDGLTFDAAMERVSEPDRQYREQLARIWRGWGNGIPFAHLHADILW